jgi:hypothetical protein
MPALAYSSILQMADCAAIWEHALTYWILLVFSQSNSRFSAAQHG